MRDPDHAARLRVLGWPTFQVLFGDAGQGVHLMRRIFDMSVIRHLPEDHPSTRQRGGDPISAVLEAGGIQIAPQYEIRLLNGDRHMECPLVGTRYAEYKSSVRRIRNHPKTAREVGIREGPFASGAATNSATSVKCASHTMRRTSVRELTGVLQARG